MMRPVLCMAALLVAAPAFALTADKALEQSRVLASKKQYDEALALLEKSEQEHPGNVELTLAIARVLSWQGRHNDAEQKLTQLDAQYDNNADVMLLRGNLAYYRGDYKTAETLYNDILSHHPDYTDAREGLARIEKARAAPASQQEYQWQLDMGYEHSGFSRVNQPSWNQEFVQITHFATRDTAMHGKVTRYEQFTNVDSEYELGVDHRFADYATAYIYGAVTPGADFRPESRVAGGGMLRVVNAEDALLPVWVTLDSRYDMYDAVDVLNVNPGVRVEPYDGWAVSFKKISVDADNAKRVYGEDYRLDGTIIDGVRFYTGFSDAPETVAAVTVNTRTWYGGVAWDVRDDIMLRAGYTHDDRDNSYIRKVINASVSYRF